MTTKDYKGFVPGKRPGAPANPHYSRTHSPGPFGGVLKAALARRAMPPPPIIQRGKGGKKG